jgi:hypothetical protein
VELRIWEPRSGNNLPLQPLDLTVPRSDSSNVVSQPGNLQN